MSSFLVVEQQRRRWRRQLFFPGLAPLVPDSPHTDTRANRSVARSIPHPHHGRRLKTLLSSPSTHPSARLLAVMDSARVPSSSPALAKSAVQFQIQNGIRLQNVPCRTPRFGRRRIISFSSPAQQPPSLLFRLGRKLPNISYNYSISSRRPRTRRALNSTLVVRQPATSHVPVQSATTCSSVRSFLRRRSEFLE